MTIKVIYMIINSLIWAFLFTTERYSHIKRIDIGVFLGILGVIVDINVLLNNI